MEVFQLGFPANESVRVLIVEDDPFAAARMVGELERGGFTPEWVCVQTKAEYLAQLDQDPDVILFASSLRSFDGIDALGLLQERGLDIPFIVICGRSGEEADLEAVRRGACDYLLEDSLARLGDAVRRALDQRRLRAERACAIEALRSSEERYRLVSEASSDYVYSLKVEPDGTMTCEWITDPFTRITGFNVEEINSRGLTSLCHPDDLGIAEQHARVLLSGRTESIEIRIITSDKQVRWIRVFERPVFGNPWNGAERVERIYGSAQDITVQKQLEEQLLQSRKMEAIGQLAGGVAHDFNNLLTVICGYGDLLRKQKDLSGTAREYADEILEAAGRAAQLTRQLLAFGRRQLLQARVVDLNSIVTDLEKLLRRAIGEDVQLQTALEAAPGFVKVDPGQMEQVIINLAVNARDAMPKGGRLTIRTAHVEYERRRHVLLTVSDTGIGMNPETAARIFEPFFTTKEIGKGTGLGLAMAYGFVKQSDGDIQVQTAREKGTTFRIYLPQADPIEEEIAEPAPFQLDTLQGTETILVLEDEQALRSLIRQVLVRAGHAVLDTGDPDEAIELCACHPGNIALFITDVELPRLSGPQVAERMTELRPKMRVMYTSGYPGEMHAAGYGGNGATFFEKPFTPDTLLREVRALLDADPVAR